MSNSYQPHKLSLSRLLVWRGAGGLFLLAVLFILAGGRFSEAPQTPEEPAAVVEMNNALEFTPKEVEIHVGETVEWRNTSLLMHTVTADPDKATLAESVQLPDGAQPFDSGNMDPEATFRHTFEKAGTYRYFCIPHEGVKMRGTVVVKPPSDG